MNVRQSISPATERVAYSVSFNNDATAFAVASHDGFSIFDTRSLKHFGNKAAYQLGRSIGQVALMQSTNGRPSNIVGLVPGGLQAKTELNNFVLYDAEKRQEVMTTRLGDRPLCVRLTSSHMLVVSMNTVRLYQLDFHDPRPVQITNRYETSDNIFGLGCLGKLFVVFPGRTSGLIQIASLRKDTVSIIPAHQSQLRALALSHDEQLIASASEKGTLIRLYSTTTSQCLALFRRGLDQASIFSLEISPQSSYLALTSDKGTLHIFSLPQVPPEGAQSTVVPSSMTTDWLELDTEALPSQPNGQPNFRKWAGLANIPLGPAFLKDVYAVATAQCHFGDDYAAVNKTFSRLPESIPGIAAGKPNRGVIGWIDEQTVAVISAGQDSRFERFIVGENDEGRVTCVRIGWKRILR